MLGARWEKSGIATKVEAGLSRTRLSSSSSRKRSTGEPYLYLTATPSTFVPVQKNSSRKLATVTASSTEGKQNKITIPNPSNKVLEIAAKKAAKQLRRKRSSSSHINLKQSNGKSASLSSATVKQSHSHKPLSHNEQEFDNKAMEPFDEKISKDIAAAVAMIVAEYEMLKRDPNHTERDVEELEETPAVTSAATTTSNLVTSTVVPDNEESATQNTEVEGGTKKKLKQDNSRATTDAQTSPIETAVEQPPPPPVNIKSKPSNNMKQETQPGTSLGGEQAQSSQLPKEKETVRNESCITLGLDLPPPPGKKLHPVAPVATAEARMGTSGESRKHLTRVQHYINSLGYHREGEPDIAINVRHSMKSHMISAKDLIHAGRPIKCLHAVILSVYLTNALESVERFPIYFRSHVGEKEYKHIVLGIYCQGHFGALGISRDSGLQDKKLIYTKLSDLIFEYAKCYHDSGHVLNEIKIGTIITHDQSSFEKLFSKIGTVNIDNCARSDIESNVEKISKQLRAKMGLACLKASCIDRFCTQPFTGRSRSRIVTRNPTTNTSGTISMAGSTSATAANTFRTRSLSVGPAIPSTINARTEESRVGLVGPAPVRSQINSKSTAPARAQAANVNTNNINAPKIAKSAQRSKTKVNHKPTSKPKRK